MIRLMWLTTFYISIGDVVENLGLLRL